MTLSAECTVLSLPPSPALPPEQSSDRLTPLPSIRVVCRQGYTFRGVSESTIDVSWTAIPNIVPDETSGQPTSTIGEHYWDHQTWWTSASSISSSQTSFSRICGRDIDSNIDSGIWHYDGSNILDGGVCVCRVCCTSKSSLYSNNWTVHCMFAPNVTISMKMTDKHPYYSVQCTYSCCRWGYA